MKLVYIYPHGVYFNKNSKNNGNKNSCATSNIDSKILWQIEALKKYNVDVTLIDLPLVLASPISFLKSSYNAYKILKKQYTCPNNEFIYHRSMNPFIASYLCLHKKHVNKIVYELQDILKYQIKSYQIKSQLKKHVSVVTTIRNLYVYISTSFLEKKIGLRADSIVSVTNEICEYYSNLTENKLKYLTLGNGITLDTISTRTLNSKTSDIINVLSVSSVYPWHGLDRFILGLASYTGNREICLHIVGNGPEIPHLKELVEKYNLSTKVVFHGFKSGAELDEMYDMCQIGLDSLGSHRKNLSEASSLKAREYCARGIPFIMAHKDTDFPDEWPYVMHVPSDDSPIGMDIVISFADAMAMDLNHPVIMRKYAEDHLSWDAKMKMLKEFLESL